MKNLLSFLKKINSQVVIFLTATIVVVIAAIITHNSPQVSELENSQVNNSQITTSEQKNIPSNSASENNNWIAPDNLVLSELKPSNYSNQNITNNEQTLAIEKQKIEANNKIKTENITPSLNLDNSEKSNFQSLNNNLQTEPIFSEEKAQVKTYFGHLPYQEGDRQRLVLVGKYYGKERFLDKEAASAFIKMKTDAKIRGINLIIISGFRSIAEQEKLFQKQIEKRGSKEEAARLSAPAGYSEHHTGYVLDIGDENNPDQDLKFTFENTEAYQWLLVNASNYGFELSFPKNNTQGVSFEPWHWRYVGSPTASKIFAATRGF